MLDNDLRRALAKNQGDYYDLMSRARRGGVPQDVLDGYSRGEGDLHAIIADQAETIDLLRAEVEYLQSDKWEAENPAPDPYWQGVYDRIRAAWDAWALAELGTASPTPLDLTGKPELDALWQTIK